MSRRTLGVSLAAALIIAPTVANAQMEQLLGGAFGAAIGGQRGGGGAAAGALIGVAFGTILQQLTALEQQKRQAALQDAARNGRAKWSSDGKSAKKATYQRVGSVQNVGGKKCQKVKEAITLPDGKQGVSTENVCFES